MNKFLTILRSDNKNSRNAKRSLKRKLKSKAKAKRPVARKKSDTKKPKRKSKKHRHYLNSRIKYSKEIQKFCDKNSIHKWEKHPKKIDLDSDFSLYNNPARVLSSLLNILYQAKTKSQFVNLTYNGHVSFGALYLIDTICYQIGSKRKWQLKHNLPLNETLLLRNLKSIESKTSDTGGVYTINNRIKINRDEDELARQSYLIKSKEIRDLIIAAIKESGTGYTLGHLEHTAIDSAITEHFDNILQHVPDAEYGFLCGSFDKNKKEVTLLIYNFGHTIADTLNKNKLPNHVQEAINEVIGNHTKNRAFFLSSKFTKDDALTLLAIQEGISSKLDADISRGHGIMDVIEQCYKLNPQSKSIIISGKTAIRIDSTYSIKLENVLGRKRRIIAFNDENNIFKKPNENNVVHLPVYFPGVIIETIIPLKY